MWTRNGALAEALNGDACSIDDFRDGDTYVFAIVNEAGSEEDVWEDVCDLWLDDSVTWIFCSYTPLCSHPLAEDYGDYVILTGGDEELRTVLDARAYPPTTDYVMFDSPQAAANWLDATPGSGADPWTSLAFVEVTIVSDDE